MFGIFTQIIIINCRNILCIQNKVSKSCILERLVGFFSFSFFFFYILVTISTHVTSHGDQGEAKRLLHNICFAFGFLISCADSVALDLKK